MDDLGAEKLSHLTRNSNKKSEANGKIFDRTNTSVIDKNAILSVLNGNEREGNSVASATCSVTGNNNVTNDTSQPQDGGPTTSAALEDGNDDSDEKEKTDATPENLKKIDDTIEQTAVKYVGISSPTIDSNVGISAGELRIVENESPSKQQQQALAFTIDFGQSDDSGSVVAATAQKYRNMVERFQNRHKRGTSMSKLEDESVPTTPISGRASRVNSGESDHRTRPSEGCEATKVKLRIRERSTSGVRDTSKRHSWSPRSSTHEYCESQKLAKDMKKTERPIRASRTTTAVVSKATGKTDHASNFSPRSTAMQLALNKVEFMCPQPPLDGFAKENKFEDDEMVSEAGTYTVDGDNYTEEQKELMNIDKAKTAEQTLLTDTETRQSRPTNLPLLSSTIESRHNNVLEISYYHDSTSLKPKISYLEKIKSRVKSITKSPDKQQPLLSDLGTFTSVTTSGVLSKKTTLDTHPKVRRKNSLTKSHIDSSEYVSTDGILRSVGGPNYPNTFTDHQKAKYKLNIFSNQKDSQILSEHYSCDTTPVHTPESPPDLTALTDTGLETAQSKNDWIQKWARNARARSTTTKTSCKAKQMSRSFNFENVIDSMQSDPIAYLNKPIDRYRNHAIGDLGYSSDTNLSERKMLPAYDYNNDSVSARPPLSPSKIPSPVHTVGRTRAASRTLGSLQDLSLNVSNPDTDIYLRKTAALISNLAQSLSRKNSFQSSKSPTSNTNSPLRGIPYHHQSQHQHQHYSADEYSPTHHNPPPGLHKRHLSYDYRTNGMSHSLNSEQLNGKFDYRSKQRERQNSFDASLHSLRLMNPPTSHQSNIIEQTSASIKQQQYQQSPIRRSSSFSIKPQIPAPKRSEQRPQQQKLVQSRAALSNKILTIQKSMSSTSFRKMYNDYDDNIEYYINDEDDLVNDYCSSDEYDEPKKYYHAEQTVEEPYQPLTNTRYNKAHLIRIERSKKQVSGSMSNQNKPPLGGVVACPNTPEMPRRSAQNAVRSSMRQSVPRDSSLNRLRGEVPNSLASAKKQLLQTATTQNFVVSKKVQPKYMDISKYKSGQGGNFLRKDESKITLATSRIEIKRSPSSASVVLIRADPVRASHRSVKSASGKPSNSASIGGTVSKQKENELAMWRRRATYDPMKAAAEGRRKQEAQKTAQVLPKDTDNSVVLRSQSFHSGVGQLSGAGRSHQRIPEGIGGSTLGFSSINSNDANHTSYRWTLTSNESSDKCDDDFHLHHKNA